MRRILGKSLDRIEDFFAFLGGILLVVAVLSVVFQVIARYFFNLSFIWINEVNEYILLYVPFLGAAWLLRHNGHVTVDLVVQILPPRIKKVSDVLVAALGSIVSATLLWYGTVVTIQAYTRGTVSTTASQIPQVYLYIVIPVGALLLLLEFIRMAFNSATGAEHDEPDRPPAE